MHTHFSAMNVLNTFLAVLIAGTVWRLTTVHLAASPNARMRTLGQAMHFQY